MPNGSHYTPKNQFEQLVVDKFELGTEKMKAIEDKIDCLPCEKHSEEIYNVKKTMWKWIGAMTAIGAIAGAIIGLLQI